MRADKPPLSIEVGSPTGTPYKSIQHVVWQEIPQFAVLTGLNGSGKTQLLHALAYKLSRTAQDHTQELNQLSFSISGETIGPDEIAYLPSTENYFQAQESSVSELQSLKLGFLGQLRPQNTRNNIDLTILRHRIERRFGIRLTDGQIDPKLATSLPDDFVFMLPYSDVSASLAHVFMSYQIRLAQALMDKKTQEEAAELVGKPPWDLVNEALQAAEFGYRIPAPANKLLERFQVRLISVDTGATIQLNDLSSGEKTILRTVLWFYNSKHNNIFPKLFLLDEPDAHLHPSMTRQFIDVLKTVLVDQYNVRVILTTHSPSTVALAPEESVFVMTRRCPSITRPASKAEAIGLLTSGLVVVSPGTRYVLVEDEADAKFYGAVRDILADQGPSKDKAALRPAPSLIFLPASTGRGKTKIGGGRNAVVQWVEKFDAEPLSEIIRGIIDLDSGNVGTPRVLVTGRYTLENYLLDPFVIFALLLDEQKAPKIAGVDLSPGDEHLIRSLPSSALQGIVDYIASRVEPNLGALADSEKMLTSVVFSSGMLVNYPAWMLNRPGHDLLPVYQKSFGQQLVVPPRLDKCFRRLRMIPRELAAIMADLQQN